MQPTTRLPILCLAVLVLLAIAAWLRGTPSVVLIESDGVDFLDPDTVRRLVRLDNLEGASEYPLTEVRDGFPRGTQIQWTLPMDWAIRALDAVVPSLHANARPFESGAAYAGPVFGLLGVLAFALLAWRLLPRGQAALASLLYAASSPACEVTRFGNGDHQSLQDACAVVALLATLVLLRGAGGTLLAGLAGAALGLSLWVNAESMVILGTVGVMFAIGLATSGRDRLARRLVELRAFATATALVTLLGQAIENPSLALEWDRISSFQTGAAITFAAFAWLTPVAVARLQRPPVAIAVAGAVVGAVFFGLLFALGGAALSAELDRAARLSAFAHGTVAEYAPLFGDGVGLARLIFGDLIWLFPLTVIGLWFASALPTAARLALAVPAILFAGLVLDQVKLSHFFAIPWALVLAAGGAGFVDLLHRRGVVTADRVGTLRSAGAVLVVALLLWNVVTLQTMTVDSDPSERRAVVQAVAALEFEPPNETAAERTAVLGPWDLGHHLLYDTDKPIVASSYQRRVDGIHDSYDVLCSTDLEAARAIMKRRRVRWWIRPGDPSFLLQYDRVVPGRPQLGAWKEGPQGRHISLSPEVRRTLWVETRKGTAPPPWLKLVYESEREQSWWGSFKGPAFRVFRVRYDDED